MRVRVDFDDMFTDVITKQPRLSAKVMCALVSGPKSITELSGAIGVGKGGDISCALSQLEERGIVAAKGQRGGSAVCEGSEDRGGVLSEGP